MATPIIDHRFHQSTLDVKTAPRVTLKYCEWCRIQFVCDKDEARFPGDYINLQRGAGKRAPIVCSRCEHDPKRLNFMREEAAEMELIARSLREERDRFQSSSPLRVGGTREFAKSREQSRKYARSSYWTRKTWLESLLKLFQEKPDGATAYEIACIMHPGQVPSALQSYNAPIRLRTMGIAVAVCGNQEFRDSRGRLRTRRLYTLSSQDITELTPLAGVQDSETKQFMRAIN